MMHTCPNCGHDLTARKARAVKPIKPTIDPSTCGDSVLFAHRKQTAPYYDLKFFLEHAHIGATLLPEASALAMLVDVDGHTRISRTDFYRRLRALQDEWRRVPTPATDAAFAHMRAQLAIQDQITAFRDTRSAMLEAVTKAAEDGKGTYYEDRAVSSVRALVSRARSCYPRVFAHEQELEVPAQLAA